jgi:hypothetical protein
MGLIISTADFKTGTNAISTNRLTTGELDSAIDTYELTILYDLFGIELYELFDADLVNGVPQSQIYLEVFNPFVKLINDVQYQSIGIKQMLVKWVYFFYVRTQSQNNAIGGNTQSENSISSMSKMAYIFAVDDYNTMIRTYKAIQTYIESKKETDYPTYKGLCKEFMSCV